MTDYANGGNVLSPVHPLVEAIGATDSVQERAFCVALIGESPDVIQRVLRVYLDIRDGRTMMPEWAKRQGDTDG